MQALSLNEKNVMDLPSRLLIADADTYLRTTLRQQLAIEGFHHVYEVSKLKDFDASLIASIPDLILLDINMPDGNSVDVCKRLRLNGFNKPIVLLATKDSEKNILLGIEAGANDYKIKPLRFNEILSCIQTQLQTLGAVKVANLKIGDLTFMPANKMLCENIGDKAQTLTEKETIILKFLYQSFPEEITKGQLLSEVWGLQSVVSTHTLETHIYRLRQKINVLSRKQLVITTEKGYRLSY